MDKIQASQIARCRKDPIYFIKKYAVIRHPTKGLLPFKLWDFQEDTLQSFLENSYNIILKARQMGISTLVAAYIAWLITFYKNKEVFILAVKQDMAINLVAKVKVVIQNLPDWMNPGISLNNRASIELANGSKVKASGTTESGARSEALSLLVIDEVAFIRNMEEIWIAAQPTLATGGDCVVLSTPNGMGNFFHKLYVQAEEGEEVEVAGKKNIFNPIKLHWSLHPERNEKWAENERKKIGIQAFAQEYDCDFLQSGSNVISYQDLKWYKEFPVESEGYNAEECPHIREPIDKIWLNKNLWIWKYPQSGKTYILTADVARGDGTDNSTFQIIDVENYEQVAEYRGKITTDMFSQLIVSTASQYNNAYVAVENIGIGHSVAMKVLELDYRNCHWTSRDPSKINIENAYMFANNPYNVPRNAVPGFTTSSKTRPLIIARLEEDIRTHSFIMHSQRLFDECMTFVFQNGKPEAMENYNDDLIMSAAICSYLRYANLTMYGSGNSVLNQVSINSRPFEFALYADRRDRNKAAESSWKMKTGIGEDDIRWLVG